jgi:hypothetical protein
VSDTPAPQTAAAEPLEVSSADLAAVDYPPPPPVSTPQATGLPLDALADEQAPAHSPPPVHGYPFHWGGREWRVKPQFDVRVVAHLERGAIGKALGLLLGKEQAEEMLNWDSEEPLTDPVLGEMMKLAAGTGGASVPES